MMISCAGRLAAAAATLFALPVLAQSGSGLFADPRHTERAKPYFDARTALEINYLCNAYKSVEHWAVTRIAQKALGETGWYEAAADMAEYDAFVDAQNRLAASEASKLGCTPVAEPIAFGFLEQAMGLIYGDLMLAFHFGSLPAGDPDRLELSEDQIAAAQQYDMYLQQRFGANFPGFAQHHRDRVGREVQEAMATHEGSLFGNDYFDPYGLYFDDPIWFPEWDFNWELIGLRADGRLAVDRVLLEVLVETHGLRMLDRQDGDRLYADLVDAADGAVRMKVWSGPASPYFYDEFDASYMLALNDTGAMRFIVWSREAADQLGETPTVAIHANPHRVPKGLESEYEFYRTPEWMAAAVEFRAERIEDCLGTMCLEFSADDVAAMIGGTVTDTVELVISPRADAGPVLPSESGYRPGGLDISLLKTLYADWIGGD